MPNSLVESSRRDPIPLIFGYGHYFSDHHHGSWAIPARYGQNALSFEVLLSEYSHYPSFIHLSYGDNILCPTIAS